MPTIRRSYLDLSPELRRQIARQRRATLRGAVGDPEQQRRIQHELSKLAAWEAGTLHLPPAPVQKPPPQAPRNPQSTPEDPLVTMEDAKALGFCGPGTVQWMESRGVNPKVGVPASFLAGDADRRANFLGRRKLQKAKSGK
jgi:hypothetical protein